MKRVSPTQMPNPRPMIGSINGAMSMAPITTATLFWIRPSTAIPAAATVIRTKRPVRRLSLATLASTSLRSS